MVMRNSISGGSCKLTDIEDFQFFISQLNDVTRTEFERSFHYSLTKKSVQNFVVNFMEIKNKDPNRRGIDIAFEQMGENAPILYKNKCSNVSFPYFITKRTRRSLENILYFDKNSNLIRGNFAEFAKLSSLYHIVMEDSNNPNRFIHCDVPIRSHPSPFPVSCSELDSVEKERLLDSFKWFFNKDNRSFEWCEKNYLNLEFESFINYKKSKYFKNHPIYRDRIIGSGKFKNPSWNIHGFQDTDFCVVFAHFRNSHTGRISFNYIKDKIKLGI